MFDGNQRGRRVVNVALRVSAKEGKGREEITGGWAGPFPRGYPWISDRWKWRHPLSRATSCRGKLDPPYTPPTSSPSRAEIYGWQRFLVRRTRTFFPSSALEQLARNYSIGVEGNVPGNTTVRLKYDFTRVELSGVPSWKINRRFICCVHRFKIIYK